MQATMTTSHSSSSQRSPLVLPAIKQHRGAQQPPQNVAAPPAQHQATSVTDANLWYRMDPFSSGGGGGGYSEDIGAEERYVNLPTNRRIGAGDGMRHQQVLTARVGRSTVVCQPDMSF